VKVQKTARVLFVYLLLGGHFRDNGIEHYMQPKFGAIFLRFYDFANGNVRNAQNPDTSASHWNVGYLVLMALLVMSASSVSASCIPNDSELSEFQILSPNAHEPIGRGEYRMQLRDAGLLVTGENRYFDGEHDLERDEIELSNTEAPFLNKFEHTFFRADGSRKLAGRADLRSGEAVCTNYDDDGQEKTTSKHIEFPRDTYAGASIIVALENSVRNGAHRASFHVFDCAPGPELVAVSAQLDQSPASWNLLRRELQPVQVTADLGWFGKISESLLPHRTIWFDPSAGWQYVGGEIKRYFANGPQVILVREQKRADAR